MKDMIARILDMDKKARGLTDEAQQSKIDYEKEIIRTKEKIKNDYLGRAKERIRINQQAAQKKADEELKRIESKNALVIEALNKTRSENHDKWVEAIVERVLSAP